ncbi:MAG: DUF2863 family protein [Proteobacteria bacterium]|nr:DUF2863 family protein [Pseudomonadota bacterium]
MKRSRFPRRSKPTPNVEQLFLFSNALGQSTSRLEDKYWEHRLEALIRRLLAQGDDEALNATLDQLYQSDDRGYDHLADLIESCCESRQEEEHDLLLVGAPILAWSRYAIPSGKLKAETLMNLRVHLQAHVLSGDAQLALADVLFSPDQLPASYSETLRLLETLGKAACKNQDLVIDPARLPEAMNFLSDTRYLLAAVAVPRGCAVFRWQEDGTSRDVSQRCWLSQGGEVLRTLFTACASEILLPQPYHAACREADRQSRPYAVRAAVAFLHTTLNITPTQLRAIVAPFYEHHLEEYRIGITQTGSHQVIHGLSWPLLEAEDETTEVVSHIETALKEAGVTDILVLDHRFPLEWCDDCGAPLYPDPAGEPVHAEMPEGSTDTTPQHLH